MNSNKFTDSLHAHGYPDFFRTRDWHIKIVWIAVLGSAMMALIYGTISNMEQYFEYPITTTVSHRMVNALPFPDVYVCPAVMIDEEKVDPYTREMISNYLAIQHKHSEGGEKKTKKGTLDKIEGLSGNQLKVAPRKVRPTSNQNDGEKAATSSGLTTNGQKSTVNNGRGSSEEHPDVTPINNPDRKHMPTMMPPPLTSEQNYQRSTYGYTRQWKLTSEIIRVVHIKEPQIITSWLTEPPTTLGTTEMTYEHFKTLYKNEPYREMLMRVGYRKQQIFKECSFASRGFDCQEHVNEIFDRDGGKCFLLKARRAQLTADSGLAMVLAETPTETSKPRTGSNYRLNSGAWMRIDPLFDPFSTKRIRLLGKRSKIQVSMRQTKTNLLHSPQSKISQICIDQKKAHTVYNTKYTTSSCVSDCIQQGILRHCGCLFPTAKEFLRSKYKNTRMCVDEESVNCTTYLMDEKWKKEAETSRKSSTEDIYEEKTLFKNSSEYIVCAARCRQPCKDSDLEISISYGMLTGLGRSNDTLVEIAFDSMVVTEVHQQPGKSVMDEISDLGGQVGIWLGASALTLIQMVLCMVRGCSRCMGALARTARGGPMPEPIRKVTGCNKTLKDLIYGERRESVFLHSLTITERL